MGTEVKAQDRSHFLRQSPIFRLHLVGSSGSSVRECPLSAKLNSRRVVGSRAAATPARPGSLPELDRYLHDRTAGMIGILSHLIRGDAVAAILTGTEAITKTVLDQVELDHAADS
jgi:hypothetical protein